MACTVRIWLPKYVVSLSRFSRIEPEAASDQRPVCRRVAEYSIVWNSLKPGRFVRVLTTGDASAAALRLNPGMFGPSSPLPSTPSSPGSRIVVGTL